MPALHEPQEVPFEARPLKPENSPAGLVKSVYKNPKRLPEESGRSRITVMSRRVSDKVLLCQLEAGFEAGTDISSALR